MCYNATASIISLMVGLISSVILTFFDNVLGLFFAWVTCMQLFDWIFWNNQKRNRVNFITTKIAMMFNLLQPIILSLLIVLFFKVELKSISKALLLLYTILSVMYIYANWAWIDYTLVDPISYPGLLWKWNYASGQSAVYTLYMALMTALIIQHFEFPIKHIFLMIFWTSFIISFAHMKNNAIGRFWCYFAAYIPLILSVLYFTMKKQKI